MLYINVIKKANGSLKFHVPNLIRRGKDNNYCTYKMTNLRYFKLKYFKQHVDPK